MDAVAPDLGIERAPSRTGGKAAVMKLALNQLIAAEIAAFALGLGLIREGESIRAHLWKSYEKARSTPDVRQKLPRLVKRRYEQPNFFHRHLLKDVDLFLAAAQQARLSTEGLRGCDRCSPAR